MWDLVVVGGGPAGATAAVAALTRRPEARVLVLDRADFPRDKACGDGVAPHALDVLAGLGVTGVVDGCVPVDRLWLGFADGPAVAGRMRRAAHVVPRTALDARLLQAALDRGAVLRRQRVREVRTVGDRVLVDGEPARWVVGADGANGVVRRAVGVRPARPGHRAVAIRGYAPVLPALRAEQRIVFAERDWPAYAWSFPIGDGRANVGYGEVVRPGRELRRDQLLAGLDRLLPGASAGAATWRAHHLPLSSDRVRQPDGRVLLAGDALSLINPLTGEGIFYAVLSGSLAGAAVAAGVAAADPDAGAPAAAYRASLRRELGRHLRHTAAASALARRRGVVSAGLRAADQDGRVFDDLVEVGLGRGTLHPRLLAGLVRSLPPARSRG